MSSNLNNLKVLIAGPENIRQGAVTRALDGNKYLVDLGNGQLIKASFSGNLAVDQMVVVGNSRGNWEVLVSKALAAKGIVDVKIEG